MQTDSNMTASNIILQNQFSKYLKDYSKCMDFYLGHENDEKKKHQSFFHHHLQLQHQVTCLDKVGRILF